MSTELTRIEQDLILAGVVAITRPLACRHAPRTTVPDLRAALRLDDKSLDHAIAWGAHKQPWSSEVTV